MPREYGKDCFSEYDPHTLKCRRCTAPIRRRCKLATEEGVPVQVYYDPFERDDPAGWYDPGEPDEDPPEEEEEEDELDEYERRSKHRRGRGKRRRKQKLREELKDDCIAGAWHTAGDMLKSMFQETRRRRDRRR
jgi:hypothetical protein